MNEAEEQRLFSKIAWRLLPALILAYIFNYLDRNNIGFAALTMNREIGLTATQFGRGAGILFLGYCFLEVPSNMILYRVGARKWIARIMISWGIISAATVFVTGPRSFYLLRFLLGAAEAGFFPGVAYYIGHWFPAQYRTRVIAWFMVAIPISSVIGGALSGSLLQMNGIAGLAGWKWLFMLEGLPVAILGFVVMAIMTERPEQATWLTESERQIVHDRVAGEIRPREVRRLGPALADPRVLILGGVQFGFLVGSYGVGIWLPQIIKGHDLSNFVVVLLSAIPYVFASAAMIIWAAGVDRSGRKIGNLTLACLLAVAGLVGSVLTGSLTLALIGLTVALIGVTSARAIFWTIPTRFLVGIGAAGGLAFINSIGTLGGFAGPYLMGFLKDETGSFVVGLLVMAGLLAITTLLAASLKLVIKEE